MKGKVKCTCGWSWNKSDSSAKDMYICHECGRDNSNNMRNGGWLDNIPKAQEGEVLYTPPKSQYKRLYGHAKDYGYLQNNMKIDPNTGYSYFPQETSLNQEKEVPDSPWNVSRFLFDPFIKNVSQGVHNAKYDKEGKLIDLPGDFSSESYRLANNLSRRERYDSAKEDITNYYKKDLKQNDDDVEKNVDDTMDLIRKMRRTEEMMQKHNAHYTNLQNPEGIFRSAVGFNELYPQKSIMGDFKFNPRQAKRAYKMFQKTWRGVSGKEARQNAREELRKAEKAFELAKEQKKQGLNKSNSSYKSNSDYDPEDQFYFDNYGTTLASAKLYDPEKSSTSITDEKEIVKPTQYYNIDPKRGKVETPGNEKGVRYIPISNSIQLGKWKEQEGKLKNGGWLDNYNDSQVSAPEGMLGDGYSNVGRNYSPAWGGQFQMGGSVYPVNYVPQAQTGASMPGAVGFTYARVGAPSKGPRRNQTDVTDASAQNGKEMSYYKNGLDWKPKTISRNGGWLDSYEEGGIIKDDRGQWDHPGEITEIGSNQITMQGVPYPVLGISDTGDIQMMYPEEEYEFDGEKVTEYPMAKNGLRQEQKGLVNLDQLTNFTNYNTKQPGGWLNKYN